MEIIALNEELRQEFSPVVKLLRHTPAKKSPQHKDVVNQASGDSQKQQHQGASRIDHFRLHMHTILQRLNTYQYGTKQAFQMDIKQLLSLVGSQEQKTELEKLLDTIANPLSHEKAKTHRKRDALHFDRSGVPGIQQVTDNEWLCNLNLQDTSVTIGTFPTRDGALEAYEKMRLDLSTSQRGLAGLYKLVTRLRHDQLASDVQMLQDAAKQCHPRISCQRLYEMRPLRDKHCEIPSNATTTITSPARSSSSESRSPSPSPARSTLSTPSKSRNPKRKKPAERLSHLRLRRLVQKRLCSHLTGQEVCVLARPDLAADQTSTAWKATGRLENGKVFSYARQQQVTFADYVIDELHRQVSACPHMFLIKTRESIDDHLAVCDAFSQEERRRLGLDFTETMKLYMQTPEKKQSNRRG